MAYIGLYIFAQIVHVLERR